MRAETLLEVTEDIRSDFGDTKVLELFQEVIEAVPPQGSGTSESSQKAVKASRQALADALSKSRFNHYPISNMKILLQAGAWEFLGSNLVTKIDAAFDYVAPPAVLAKLKEIKQILLDLEVESKKYVSGATYFDVAADSLPPGTFEIIVGIPGQAIQNELESLGKETLKINRILGVFTEIATGSREQIKVRAVASSDPTFFLVGAPAVAALVATAIERVAAFYEKILTIVKMQRDLKSHEIPADILTALKNHIDETMSRNLKSLAVEIEERHFQRIEAIRRQELRTDLLSALSEIAKRLDDGYLFDVRGEPLAEPIEEGAEPSQSAKAIAEAIKRVEELRPRLHQFEAERDPALRLLSHGDEPPSDST